MNDLDFVKVLAATLRESITKADDRFVCDDQQPYSSFMFVRISCSNTPIAIIHVESKRIGAQCRAPKFATHDYLCAIWYHFDPADPKWVPQQTINVIIKQIIDQCQERIND